MEGRTTPAAVLPRQMASRTPPATTLRGLAIKPAYRSLKPYDAINLIESFQAKSMIWDLRALREWRSLGRT